MRQGDALTKSGGIVPIVGMLCSQYGNVMFPARELRVPSLGMTRNPCYNIKKAYSDCRDTMDVLLMISRGLVEGR